MAQYALKQHQAIVIVQVAQIFLRIAEVIGATRIFVAVIGLADRIIDNLYLEEKIIETYHWCVSTSCVITMTMSCKIKLGKACEGKRALPCCAAPRFPEKLLADDQNT